MNRYRVLVMASYPPEADVMGTMGEMQRESGVPLGTLYFETTASDWVIEESVLIPPLRQTLTATYDNVEGRDEDEASQLALAIYDNERRRASLPDPETVVHKSNDSAAGG